MFRPTGAKIPVTPAPERGEIRNEEGKPMRLMSVFGALAAVSFLALPIASSAAEMRGVTATEIRIGQTMPYSGPVSAFGALGKGEAAISRCSTSAAASTAARSI
jgi:hypothetical protein